MKTKEEVRKLIDDYSTVMGEMIGQAEEVVKAYLEFYGDNRVKEYRIDIDRLDIDEYHSIEIDFTAYDEDDVVEESCDRINMPLEDFIGCKYNQYFKALHEANRNRSIESNLQIIKRQLSLSPELAKAVANYIKTERHDL